ncbi:TPA: HlyD family secretion protein [Klebsiella quasipneumoniae subsp. similipneumoniae]|uniref:HlyD family secretion protein n=1 Tax=Klebsiella quasipneumoniae TaxID=1463165 RepID=UPI000C7BB76A|nr:HlyD family secretion protein [Klebsiella quasipneumoniae]MBF7805923.1 HlyD family secretion protein [Klebsiella quasipneumoniae]MCJ1856064.1 HlyD family secretion protein [Klebsiella quasipneumoniae subsp. similipneumoniae]MCQ3891449.1 HlyD family secretion protein [Klebsiella quasipneumoniae]PLC97241.1 HlyD family secretion protein [Klebsiella quasipneumoniae]HBR1429338.1 HlyD family secretion protein [Klebsiella quasipneumoniae subsp. similipneumoniae]
MLKKLYRKEAVEYKKSHWRGKALLLNGLPAWLILLLSTLFLMALISALIFGKFTQRIDVKGEVITLPHSINVFSPQQGFIIKQYVKIGDIVKKDQALYEIDVSRNTSSGNVSAAQIASINDKIENSNDIIKKLIDNKSQTINALNEQLKTSTDSLKETNRMLQNTQAGLKKMHANLASYDKYLSDGLITKDQYNYQHSLYFQQQSAYQSLVSQKMQLESQITQLNSDRVTKAADFDNQISSQYNQANDYKNQLVESNANGSLIIKATSDGRVESLSATQGQTVENGSSLAQIKPTGNVEYYLILWLPNNAIPYLKVGDPINIRYDAFPSDKFGQFPGTILSISSMPASRQEMSEYTNVSDGTAQQELALYKAIVKIKDKEFKHNGKTLRLSNGLKAQAVVFLEERPLYMWMFTPVYKISQSVSGPVND